MLFSGTCEIDETFIGGKYENMHADKKATQPQKTVVLGMINRETGQAISEKVASTKYHDLGEKVMERVKVDSKIITDELSSYKTLRTFYKHESVNHSKGEYVRGEAYTNTTDGYFGLIKRTIYGTWHWTSAKHLNKYLAEINYRYNNRAFTASVKFSAFFDNLRHDGDVQTYARLKYKKLISPAYAE